MEYVLTTNELTKTYKKASAVDRVSMHVARGEIYGFVGRNGAGKSTLMKMLAGLVLPTAGEIEILGADGAVAAVVLDTPDGPRTVPVEGVFLCVGQRPQNGPFAGVLDLDADGYAASGEDCRTRTPGIFAAGDCRAKAVRQLTTAVADGAVAALAACGYLNTAGPAAG